MSGTDYLKTNKNVFYYLNCYKKSKFMRFDKWLQIHNNLSDENYEKIDSSFWIFILFFLCSILLLIYIDMRGKLHNFKK